MSSHKVVGVFMGRNRGHHRHAEHDKRGRPPDDPIPATHRAPPAASANSVVIAMSIMYVRCVSVHWVRDTAYREDSGTGYRGSGPQVMATCRNIAISLLYLAGVTAINRTLQAIGRDRTRMLSYLPL
jgi:hypothetical protein